METFGGIVNCGGVPVHYTFLHPETAGYFRGYLDQELHCDSDAFTVSVELDATAVSAGAVESAASDVSVGSVESAVSASSEGSASFEELRIQCTEAILIGGEYQWLVGYQDVPAEFLEFNVLMLATGSQLLSRQRALFHGAAFSWKNLAWIMTAPSGTGKTTQLVHWLHTQRRDVKTINGDKPVLDCSAEGSVYVCSSPWRGKERYGHPQMREKMGGIIFLRQGSTNVIRRMEAEEAVPLLFAEFIASHDDAEEIRQQADLLDRIMRIVPVWELVNVGDEAAALLTQQVLGEYLQSQMDDKKSVPQAQEPDVEYRQRKTDGRNASMSGQEINTDNQQSRPDRNSLHLQQGVMQPEENLRSRPTANTWYLRQGVTLVNVAGVYLLTADRSAQKECDFICRINETGALIWEMLQRGASLPSIVTVVQEQYEAPDAYVVEADVRNFMAALRSKGYITQDVSMPERSQH